MVLDAFETWYEKTYPDIDPLQDDFYEDLWEAYHRRRKRALEVEDALEFLVQQTQNDREYD